MSESVTGSRRDELTPFADFARSFLCARSYSHALGSLSANNFQVTRIQTRSIAKGLDLLAWRL